MAVSTGTSIDQGVIDELAQQVITQPYMTEEDFRKQSVYLAQKMQTLESVIRRKVAGYVAGHTTEPETRDLLKTSGALRYVTRV